jgi:HlyD family secretion protein
VTEKIMRKTRNRILIGLAAVATGALLVWAFAPRPLPVETAAATIGRFERSIDEDARTRVRDRYVISAPLAGQVSRIALREGDAVGEKTTIATLAPALSPMLDARSEAQLAARVEAADAAVARAQTRIARARTALTQARNTLRREEALARERFIAAIQLDNDRLAVRAAEQELASAEADRHVAGHELEQARAALGAARQDDRTAFAVRAPVAGRVLRVVQPSAGTVALGAPLLELGDLAQLEIVAELLTGDALQASPGTPVRIERWGGTGALNGRVRRIEPAGFTKVSALGVEEQRVNVLIELTDPPERWRALGDGYRVAVRLLVVVRDKVLTVPVGAVFPRPGGGDAAAAATDDGALPMAVFVVEDDRARLREVKVGDRNGRDAWIVSGLRDGERVIVYPGDAIADGVRVETRGVRPAR